VGWSGEEPRIQRARPHSHAVALDAYTGAVWSYRQRKGAKHTAQGLEPRQTWSTSATSFECSAVTALHSSDNGGCLHFWR
jgi:hypothetical protein